MSTMLYLMALQDITSSPFRAVDEINQVCSEYGVVCVYMYSMCVSGVFCIWLCNFSLRVLCYQPSGVSEVYYSCFVQNLFH